MIVVAMDVVKSAQVRYFDSISFTVTFIELINSSTEPCPKFKCDLNCYGNYALDANGCLKCECGPQAVCVSRKALKRVFFLISFGSIKKSCFINMIMLYI